MNLIMLRRDFIIFTFVKYVHETEQMSFWKLSS